MASRPLRPHFGSEVEREVDQAIAVCGGDIRAALRSTLVANAFLEAEVERLARAVSRGFTRRRTSPPRQASEKVDDWREASDD
jgi:hypothetical protein